MILLNGATGTLGRFLVPQARNEFGYEGVQILQARLESEIELRMEICRALSRASSRDEVTLIPLAGMVSVDLCQKDPSSAHRINVEFLERLVRIFHEEAVKVGLNPRVLYLSSAHVYAGSEAMLSESAPLHPRSIYASNKVEAEEILSRTGLRTLIFRIFGILGTEQPPHFLLPSLIRRVKEKRLSQIPGLELSRDYLDSRDVARILVKALGSRWPDSRVFNLCSGVPVTIREVLNQVIQEAPEEYRSGLQGVEISSAPGRDTDIPVLVGDPSQLIAWLGQPTRQIPLSKTIRDAWAANLESSPS